MNLSIFGAPKIDISQLEAIQKDSPELIIYAIPVMAFFTFLEIWYSWHSGTENYSKKESLGSLFVGLGNVGINLLAKAGLVFGCLYIYNLVPWRMEYNWWTLIPCLLILDCCSYWAHRISHSNRLFWAAHVVHHTAENYNLTVSFRLSWIQHLKLIFFLPVALFGFHPVIFFVANQIAVLFQFWQHTEYIDRLHPLIEKYIVTPSNHRVHHGSDKKYIDKNFGVILITWDKLFGTYHPEEEKPTYGVTTPIEKRLSPFYLNFHELKDIVVDVKKAVGLKGKLFYLFGNPSRIAQIKLKESLKNADPSTSEKENFNQSAGTNNISSHKPVSETVDLKQKAVPETVQM